MKQGRHLVKIVDAAVQITNKTIHKNYYRFHGFVELQAVRPKFKCA